MYEAFEVWYERIYAEEITIAKKIFGKDGLVDANLTIEFEKKSKQIIKDSENYPAFISYFKKRLHPNIEAYIKDPDRQTKVGTNWTNNNCESINHVFKLDADWKTNTMPNMINLIHEIILLHFKDFKRSLYGEGNFRLHGKFRKQQIKPSIWRSLSSENRQEKFKIFLENKKTKENISEVKSSWCNFKVRQIGVAKKPHQRKRSKATKTKKCY